jgi:2-iminobutanoate/2-iminopropanoate deaminase
MRFATLLFFITAVTMTLAQSGAKQIVRVEPDAGLPFSAAVKAGGLIFVAGTLGTDAKGAMSGDIKAQTRQTLDNINATLQKAGSSLANAASAIVYLKSQSDFAAMNEVYRSYWPKDPPTRTTVVASLVRPEALIEISMVAVPNGAERVVVHPSDWLQSPNPYSYGIKSGNTLFLSGLVSRNGKDNSVVSGDMSTQTKTVLDNGAAILKAAGMSYADVVSSRVFITDIAKFQDMNAAYRTYFPSSPPARATVRAGLMGADYLVEITMVAVKDASRRAVSDTAAPAAPAGNAAAPLPLSPGIQVGNRLYVSGMLGNTADNKGNANAQTAETLSRIGRTLKAGGFEWTDVVDGVVYLPDMANYKDMNAAYKAVIPKDFPARATVGVGLVAADGLVEIMMTAVK